MKKDETHEAMFSFEQFVLPFLPAEDALAEENEDQEELSPNDQLERMQEIIPDEAYCLGRLSGEIDHSPGMTWATEDFYYILPWTEPDFDWALFRITFDDNWGRFEWSADARIKGIKDGKKAARQLFRALMDHWQKDLEAEDNAAYREFLEGI